jgi:hypothetical protein
LTENVSLWPPATVTVTVHCSADAAGSAASAETTSTTLVQATAKLSFRLLNAMAYLLPPSVSATPVPRPLGGADRTLLTAIELCNVEPLLGLGLS